MKKPALILLGLATLWPLAYFAIFILEAVRIAMKALDGYSMDPDGLMEIFTPMIALAAFTTLLSIALMVIYIVHAKKNMALDDSGRMFWTLLFIFLGAFAMPVYYVLYAHPWAQNEPDPTSEE